MLLTWYQTFEYFSQAQQSNRRTLGYVSHSWCCVLGNESTGVSDATTQACAHRIRIGMDDEVDSLSVPIATGILLHGLKEREAH
jgi:tRNA G18 (ribose-2'-O)-methylase SpoU